jgi:hypothetical protein
MAVMNITVRCSRAFARRATRATLLASLALSLCGASVAQEIKRFQAQQPARASEVNDNFAALASMPMPKPSFRSSPSPTVVTIPATATSPVRVRLRRAVGGESNIRYLQSTSPLEANLATSGVGGLDTGSIQPASVYYLYVVEVTAGAVLGAIVSLSPPTVGPSNLSASAAWTYVGGFRTAGTPIVIPFRSVNGRYAESASVGEFEVSTTSTTATGFQLAIPPHAHAVRGRLQLADGTPISPPNSTREGRIGSTSTETLAVVDSQFSKPAFRVLEWPLLEERTIYLSTFGTDPTVLGATLTFRTLGWSEDPSAFP